MFIFFWFLLYREPLVKTWSLSSQLIGIKRYTHKAAAARSPRKKKCQAAPGHHVNPVTSSFVLCFFGASVVGYIAAFILYNNNNNNQKKERERERERERKKERKKIEIEREILDDSAPSFFLFSILSVDFSDSSLFLLDFFDVLLVA